MKKMIALVLIIGSFAGLGALAANQDALSIPSGEISINHPVKELYSAPSEYANPVYSIPIEVKLLGISEDGNWFKVKIAYSFGPFSYTYVGWTHIPVGQILAEREASLTETASFPFELEQ